MSRTSTAGSKEGILNQLNVHPATFADIPAWLELTAEVESLFGRMVNDPLFLAGLTRTIERGMAFGVWEQSASEKTHLLGGILFAIHRAPVYKITWLAVTAHARRQGIGRLLVNHVLTLVVPPAQVEVITFTSDQIGGAPARQFYHTLGFVAAETLTLADGSMRQRFYKVYNS